MILFKKTLMIGKGEFSTFYGWEASLKYWVTSSTPINIFSDISTLEDVKKNLPKDIDPEARVVNIKIIIDDEK